VNSIAQLVPIYLGSVRRVLGFFVGLWSIGTKLSVAVNAESRACSAAWEWEQGPIDKLANGDRRETLERVAVHQQYVGIVTFGQHTETAFLIGITMPNKVF
jgi:hypothetical protein